ncbi:CoA-binding protein [Methylomagnum sp.]
MTSKSLIELLNAPGTLIAVVGATDDPRKFGHAIYRDLKRKGYLIYPVNPHRPTVDGDPAYPNLAALPRKPDLVNLVIPPEVGLSVLRECLTLGLSQVWLQPGTASPDMLDFLDAHGFVYLADACVMVEGRLARSPRNNP